MLDSAFLNFKNAASSFNDNLPFVGVLFLTEDHNQNWFVKHSSKGSSGKSISKLKSWNIRSTQEECALIVEKNSYERIFIIAGKQINTLESLEVLALATTKQIPNGNPIRETISEILSVGGIPVLPWGFGKWLGKRGKVISQILNESKQSRNIFLGDNGGRPSFWRNPSHFKQAEKLRIQILPGSDPLPFEWEIRRLGSYGFSFCGSLNLDYPTKDLKKIILNPENRLQTYGELENFFNFVKNQVLIQVRKIKKI